MSPNTKKAALCGLHMAASDLYGQPRIVLERTSREPNTTGHLNLSTVCRFRQAEVLRPSSSDGLRMTPFARVPAFSRAPLAQNSGSVQGQRTFFLTTSAETGKPSWILRRSISPKPKSWQKRIRDSHAGCKPGDRGRGRTLGFPLSGSVCLIALPSVSTESDSMVIDAKTL